jgi:hypothetical protein
MYYLIVTLGFLISYLFLPKDMWAFYFSKERSWGIMAILFFIIFIPLVLLLPSTGAFALGFWLTDPISFRFTMYPRLKSQKASNKAS